MLRNDALQLGLIGKPTKAEQDLFNLGPDGKPKTVNVEKEKAEAEKELYEAIKAEFPKTKLPKNASLVQLTKIYNDLKKGD